MTSTSTATPSGEKITIDDIRGKLREVSGEVDRGVETAKQGTVIVAVVGVTLLVAAAYLLGRRRGKKRQTVLEIRRI